MALAALIVPNVLPTADDARVTAAKTDVTNLMQALKLYRLTTSATPPSSRPAGPAGQADHPPVPNNWKNYLDQLPKDPWGSPYVYLNPGIKGEVDVMSYGADGQAGGEGKNADIGSCAALEVGQRALVGLIRGFTLLELLVVLAIVALASAGIGFAPRDDTTARLKVTPCDWGFAGKLRVPSRR